MKEQYNKIKNAKLRTARTRSKMHGTMQRPRLSVYISNHNVSAQIINDDEAVTLVSATSDRTDKKLNLTEKASRVGKEIAQKAMKLKIKKVIMDRGSKKYHGRIKALADEARENGLEF